MSQTLQTLTLIVAQAPANPIPGYKPILPGPLKGLSATVLGWTAGIGLVSAVLGGTTCWALSIWGENTARDGVAAGAKKGIRWSLIAAGGIGVTSSLVWTVYAAAAKSAGG